MLGQLSSALDRRGLLFVVFPAACEVLGATQIWRTIGPVAVVSLNAIDDTVTATLRRHGIHVVEVLYNTSKRRRSTLLLPNQRFGEIQVEHLYSRGHRKYSRGHRKLGFADSDDPRLDVFRRARLAGVRAACARLDLAEPVVNPVRLNPEAAERAIRRWRSGDPPVSGTCAYNDDVALAVLAGLHRLNLSAPDDLAVIGVDDIPAAVAACPPLTTVTTEFRVFAEHIADTVIRALDGRAPGRHPGTEHVRVVGRESA
jgi:DNA-binding LacI/PurR family transcriptional regulator